jgi:hypothetical protein
MRRTYQNGLKNPAHWNTLKSKYSKIRELDNLFSAAPELLTLTVS